MVLTDLPMDRNFITFLIPVSACGLLKINSNNFFNKE